jgi:hypothetical protein
LNLELQRHWEEMDEMFSRLLDDMSGLIPNELRDNVAQFVRHNEFGLAFEELVAGLISAGLAVTPDWFVRIGDLGQKMGMNRSKWAPLKQV